MFYKIINNDMVVDLLQKINYVRYLPKSKRWIITDSQSAHGIMGSDQNTIYLLQGRSCPYEEQLIKVFIEAITEEEYMRFANEAALRKKENEKLVNRINSLEEQIAQQTILLEALLAKLQ